ncbi:geranylgeranylglyceryl/heptaprenylglyceryl phosphate synthase [Tumebacillus avium]|uniref:Heptaprenylglyceryl phosphate synthase n=1 Tax=Tumebacillus avium TaxID=1903704 RepID=A0A1Y0II82_9BACL|nr:heptaprenylglyceryl phosphate synthase [Tumebacillus avium]ARU60168.1 geranylgeranylglyceryl/heptaprenylglyceryl phosphate synthase [Tumebacillus avium]
MTTAHTSPPWRHWRHVVKLDPARQITDEVVQAIAASGTDAVFLGGTQDITYENTNTLLGRLRRHAPQLPLWQEVSASDAVVDGVDGYCIPIVLNTTDPHWLIGAHAQAIEKFGPWIDWSKVLVEGYLVLNPDAAVAQLTGANTALTPQAAASYAAAAEALFSMPVLYVEYSGTFGDPALLAEVARTARRAHIFYGGGIDSYEKAATMAQHADTLIIGNALYTANWQQVLHDTIRAVK